MPKIEDSILSDTRKFTDLLFKVISERDSNALINVFQSTQKKYFSHSWKQRRAKEFDDAILEIKTNPLPVNMLSTVKLFLTDQKWDRYSANTFFMLELIRQSGYKRNKTETDNYLHKTVLEGLGESLRNKISSFLQHEKAKQIDNHQSQVIREGLCTVEVKDLPHILLAESLACAREMQVQNPDKTVFLLAKTFLSEGSSRWRLAWLNILGEPCYLPPGAQLSHLLRSIKGDHLPDPNADLFDQLKLCCESQLPEYKDVYVFDNPLQAADFAKRYPDKHGFCLSKGTSVSSSSSSSSSEPVSVNWQLTWYNRQGKASVLPIQKNLKKLLKNSGGLPDANSPLSHQVKCCLLISTTELLSSITLLINPEASELQGVVSAFVLNCKLPEATLFWYDSMGIEQAVKLDNWPELKSFIVLHQADEVWDFSSKNQLRKHLMHISLRSELAHERKLEIGKQLIKEHGVSLVASNDLSTIPRFRLIVGTYFLIREPKDMSGAWRLYRRVKGTSETGPNFEPVITDTWSVFHDILDSQGDALPQSLPKSVTERLRHIIKSYEAVERKIKINAVDAESKANIDALMQAPDTFIISKHQDQWVLYYVNTFNQLVDIHWHSIHAVAILMNQWSGEVDELSRSQLCALDVALEGYKPVGKINLSNSRSIERLFAPYTPEKPAIIPGKLALENYSAVSSFFGARPVKIPEETGRSVTPENQM